MKTMSREQLEDVIMGVFDENPGLILDLHKPVARIEVDTIHLRVSSHQTGVCVSEMQRNANPGRANMLRKGA
ncbi:hypothetical protein DPMN_122114 [Dreissena polymorpha]|uniref:Uncharacterized protein n=1 Tax=Dreissena polymorpha TaxID=45954 RepID=A0A9D4JTT8_DREPO|nr:hypothetical protein DPMN_122114 [Dreissena polymorpha]